MTDVQEAARKAAKQMRQVAEKNGRAKAKNRSAGVGDGGREGAAAGEPPRGRRHMFVLMDESGSMNGLEEAVVTGCNEFMREVADVRRSRTWLAMFDKSPGEPRTRFLLRAMRRRDLRPLAIRQYNPRGMTPLNDAIVDAVVALDHAAEPQDTVFLAIITDGMENASETSTDEVRRLLKDREAAGWGIVFLGANQDTVRTAADYGMNRPGRAFNFDATREGVAASMCTVSHLARSRSAMAPGARGREMYDAIAETQFNERGGRADGGDEDAGSRGGPQGSPRRRRSGGGGSGRRSRERTDSGRK